MQFSAYSDYKNSGVEWLGDVPEHWNIFPIGHGLEPIKNNNVGEDWNKTQLLSLTLNGIIERDINSGKGKSHSDYSTYQRIEKGDFVFCLFDIEETPRTVGLSTKQGMITSAYTAFKPNHNVEPKFLYYLFESIDEVKGFGSEYSGLRKTIRPTRFVKLNVCYPTIDEQNQIADFLDNETAKIDNLIAKQEQLIVLLEEQRKSVISHAVTKGLDPNAPMKDSGVEWLGEVPKHWDIASYKQICKIYRGKFTHRPRNDPSLYDGIYPFIQTGDIAKNKHLISSYSQTLNEKGKAVSQLFPKGTLIMAIAANIGDVSILGFDAYAPDSIIGFAPKDNLLLDFLRYSFKASLPALEQVSTKNTQSNLNIDRVGSVKTTLPPLEEQQKIIDFIETENSKIDNLIQKQQQLISQLKEYRTSVISHAVTGKIKVTP